MSTAKQIAANRLNSQKATGPRTSRGKAASRFNSLKHGLYATQQFIFDETAEQLAELGGEYQERHNPSNPEECALVETLVDSEWRLRRLRRVETHLWDRAALHFQIQTFVKEDPLSDPRLSRNFKASPPSSGEAFLAASADFERHQRIVNSAQREYHAALKDLVARAVSLRTPQPQESTPGSAKLASLRQNSRSSATEGSEPAHPAESSPKPAPQPQHPTAASAKSASFRQNPQSPANPPKSGPAASQSAPSSHAGALR